MKFGNEKQIETWLYRVVQKARVWNRTGVVDIGVARISAAGGGHSEAWSRLEMRNKKCRYEPSSHSSFSIVAWYSDDLFSRHPLRHVALYVQTGTNCPLNSTPSQKSCEFSPRGRTCTPGSLWLRPRMWRTDRQTDRTAHWRGLMTNRQQQLCYRHVLLPFIHPSER